MLPITHERFFPLQVVNLPRIEVVNFSRSMVVSLNRTEVVNFVGFSTMIKDGKPVKITNLKDYLEFKGRTDLLEKIVIKSSKSRTK